MVEVDSLYFQEAENVAKENILIEAANHTRRALRMRCLSLQKVEDRTIIRNRILGSKGFDVLKDDFGNAPTEIRFRFIRAYLKSLKQMFMDDESKYQMQLCQFKQDEERRVQQEAFLNRYGGMRYTSKVAPPWKYSEKANKRQHKNKRRSSTKTCALSITKNCDLNRWVNPIPPKFQILLCNQSLERLIELSNDYVSKLKNAWKPETLSSYEINDCEGFIINSGKLIAKQQYSLLNP